MGCALWAPEYMRSYYIIGGGPMETLEEAEAELNRILTENNIEDKIYDR